MKVQSERLTNSQMDGAKQSNLAIDIPLIDDEKRENLQNALITMASCAAAAARLQGVYVVFDGMYYKLDGTDALAHRVE